MTKKISAVYKIVNTMTGDSYVGSSRNVMRRLSEHKCPSKWKNCPNKILYQDMQKYGIENFRFQILAPVMPEYLKQVEQEFIEMLKPTYNDRRSEGWDVERYKETDRKRSRKYLQTEKGKEALKKYRQTDAYKESHRKASRKYSSQLCSYNGEQLTFRALYLRFRKAGIEHPTLEAKKYLIKGA